MQRFSSLSDLKLRGSWARTGNQAFANYQQFSTYLVGNAQAQYQFGNDFVSTIRPSAVDPNIKWEATRSYDLGLDFGFNNQRFTGAIDWYDKKTNDLIFTVPVAAGTNLSNFVTTNIGSMKNRGLEFSLSAQVLRGGSERPELDRRPYRGAQQQRTAQHQSVRRRRAQQILVGGIAGGVGTTIQVLHPGRSRSTRSSSTSTSGTRTASRSTRT